ncbi:OsmC family protein [Psychromonas hadalis]|uniref:OsmC family protein n=1 Tax=Psychromonas hadalis TaxID=211669 RepID=UPI0004123DD1|nr:OsmC family protein [Psychromonas hadalis]
MSIAPPAEFDGPGDQWSPETLMMSAVAGCFILSFKAVSKFSKFEWVSIDCHSEGILDRVEKTTRFVQVTNKVKLVISEDSSKEKALTLLEKAEAICLVSNSLNATLKLECEIVVK